MRAVAIIAVLLFHVGMPGFPGGYVGVDVFYVISGFLITGLLHRELVTSGRIDLVAFYARRARRLLPAALLVVAVTLGVSALVLSSLRFPSVAADSAAAALYVVNYRFALNATDYLGSAELPSPLLHYWSLGVEEQFYLLWPVLILVSAKAFGASRLPWLVGAIAVGSFAASLVWTDIAAPWAFFSLPTRAWELAVGALVFLAIGRLARIGASRLTSLLGLAGLLLIGAAVVLIDRDRPYPGVAAIAPVVGTALLIVGGLRSSGLSSRFLASPLPRWFGRISYSLYLWHWPVLILIPLAIGRDDLPTRLVLVVAAIGLAALSTSLLEEPIRDRRVLGAAPARTVALAGATSIVVAAAAIGLGGLLPLVPPESRTVAQAPASAVGVERSPHPSSSPTESGAPPNGQGVNPTGGVPATAITDPTSPPLPAPVLEGPLPADLSPSLRTARDDLPRSYADGCHLDFATTVPPACVYGVPDAPTTIMLVGDSHAAQWLPALQALANQRSLRLVALTKSGCPAVNVTVWNQPLKRAYRECGPWRREVQRRVEAERPSLVIVSSARDYQIVDDAGRHPFDESLDAWRDGFVAMLRRLAGRAERLAVIADTPRHADDPLECLARSRSIEACPSSRDAVVDDGYSALEADAARDGGALFLSATDWLCPGASCPLVMGSVLVYRDTQHLTATFARLLAQPLGHELGSDW
jgi:peptidoglycan/LPS O-acetylase OafA/YrhL